MRQKSVAQIDDRADDDQGRRGRRAFGVVGDRLAKRRLDNALARQGRLRQDGELRRGERPPAISRPPISGRRDRPI